MTAHRDPSWEVCNGEPLFKFRAPLLDQRRGHENEYLSGRIVDENLPNNRARLDALAKPDLVGEKVTLKGVLKDAAHRGCLVRHDLDRCGNESAESLRRGPQGAHPM